MGRLSQAISEGDGISILVEVSDAAAALAAEEQGAEGLVLRAVNDGFRPPTALPVLWHGPLTETSEIEVDAVVIDPGEVGERLSELVNEARQVGLELVVRVEDEESLERALAELDPEILLLAAGETVNGDELARLLELLPDVPAGKLAIAELAGAGPDDVAELERAGVDAVLVTARDVGALVGDPPPEV